MVKFVDFHKGVFVACTVLYGVLQELVACSVLYGVKYIIKHILSG